MVRATPGGRAYLARIGQQGGRRSPERPVPPLQAPLQA
jgi:hypothetical protein